MTDTERLNNLIKYLLDVRKEYLNQLKEQNEGNLYWYHLGEVQSISDVLNYLNTAEDD